MAQRLHGREAIEYAERTPGAKLCHYTTPLEEAREGISLEVAREIVREDPGLVYVDMLLAEARERSEETLLDAAKRVSEAGGTGPNRITGVTA